MVCLFIFRINNWLEEVLRALITAPKVENASPWSILLCVPATTDFQLRNASVNRKGYLSECYPFSIRIIEPESNPTRRQESKGFGIREVDGILLPGRC